MIANKSVNITNITSNSITHNIYWNNVIGSNQTNAYKVLVYDVSGYSTIKVTDGPKGTAGIFELIMCNDIIDDKTLVEPGNCYNKLEYELQSTDVWTVELNTDEKRYALVSVLMNELKDPENLNISGTRK